jgi:beta-aspartyl-peptidase (threonine type)
MKTLTPLLGLIVLLPGAGGQSSRRCCYPPPCCPPAVAVAPPAAGPSGEEAVRAVLDAQVAAWNKGDLESFMNGYWQSPELTFFSGNNRTQGWQATLDRYRKRYQAEGQEMGQLTFSELKVEMLGPDAAFVRARFQLVRSKDKPTGLFTLIFKRLPEGWRIVHDHTSS